MVRMLFGMSVGFNSIRFGGVPIEIIFRVIQTLFNIESECIYPIPTFSDLKNIWNGSDIVWNVSWIEQHLIQGPIRTFEHLQIIWNGSDTIQQFLLG